MHVYDWLEKHNLVPSWMPSRAQITDAIDITWVYEGSVHVGLRTSVIVSSIPREDEAPFKFAGPSDEL